MTGTDRLRTLAGARDEWILGGTLAEIADQIERELQEERDRWDSELCEAQMDKSRVTVVYLEMNKHVLGHEGMEDSPVARWARELREALGGAVTDEDREAAEWVRDHGGIDYVKGEWRSRVPHERYESRRQRLLGHIAECESALGRRNQRIEELGKTIEFFQLNNSNFRHLLADVAERLGFTRYGDDYEPEDLLDALDRRLMPEGCEWPRYESGELVQIGDEFIDHEGLLRKVERIVLMGDGYLLVSKTGPYYFRRYGQRVKRPAVLAADGEPLEVGQTVWSVGNGIGFTVVGLPKSSEYQAVKLRLDDGAFTGLDPDQLTHERPVLDADGAKIYEGEMVYDKDTGSRFDVSGFSHDCVVCTDIDTCESDIEIFPSQLTHTKPELDTWEKVEHDAKAIDEMIDSEWGGDPTDARDLVRRCRALAERERGE